MPIGDAPRVASGYTSESASWGLALADAMERVPALRWPESVPTYAQMRTDPQIEAVLKAYTLPLQSGTTLVNPAGCRDEVVDLVADCFGLQIAGSTDDPGPARRRGVIWDEHLRMALLYLPFGHMYFGEEYEIRERKGRTVAWLSRLIERMPTTIAGFDADDRTGDLKGIKQYGDDRIIRASDLTYYVHEREGANWAGRSILRSAYGPWLIKHEMWRVLATSSSRFGAGTPEVQAPPGATEGQLIEAERLAQSIRVGAQGGVGLPHGFTLNLRGITGSVPDTLGFVRYLDSQIAQSVLASVLNLDSSPNGSRALGETMIGLLEMSWLAVAREIEAVATRLAIKIVDYTFGEDEAVPRIQLTDINRPSATVEAITALIGAGAITPDPALEAALRQRLRLPDQVAELADQVAGDQRVTRIVKAVQDLYLGVGTIITATEARELLNQAGASLPATPDETLVGRPSTYQAVPTPKPVDAEVPEDAKVEPADAPPSDAPPSDAPTPPADTEEPTDAVRA